MVFIFALYIGLAVWKSAVTYIWSNEAWFASPALTLIHKGYLGTTILESKGTWMDGIEHRTYWVPPVYPLFEAGWYEIFGFSLFSLRSISVVAGAATLFAWYHVISNLAGSRSAGLLALAVIATEPRFIIVATLGRPDMLCAGLGSLSFAVYLHYRSRSLPHAILAAHALAAASCLTHPCGVMYASGLILFLLYFDRQRARLRDCGLVALPYLAGLAGWGIYILQAPSQFVHQFFGNISGIASEFAGANRWSGLTSPLVAFKREYFLRYGSMFGWYDTDLAGRFQLLILFIYTLAIVGCVLTRSIRNHPGYRVLLLLGLFDFVVLGLFDGLKATAYLVHTLPLCAAFLAIFIVEWTRRRSTAKRTATIWIVALAMTVFGVTQLSANVLYNSDQPMREDYQAALSFLRRANARPADMIAAGEFAFAFGFDSGITDDLRLGYFSGKRPAFIVTNPVYHGWFEHSARSYPAIHAYMMELLASNYRLVFHNSSYKIYERSGAVARRVAEAPRKAVQNPRRYVYLNSMP